MKSLYGAVLLTMIATVSLSLLAFLAMMTFGIHDMLGPLREGMR